MRVVVDTDALTKLAAGGVLEAAVGLLGAALSECGRLPAVLPMLQRGRLHDRLGEQRCAAIRPLAAQMPVAPPGSPQWLNLMVGVQGIDPGEAQLLAVAAGEATLLLITGDKRSLMAACAVADLCAALAGRVVTLEAILLKLCNELGVEAVRQHMGAALDLDTALRVCFSAGDCVAALASYQRNLATSVGEELLWGNDL